MENVVETYVYVYVNLGGNKVPLITDAVVNMWIVMAVLIAAAYFMTRKMNDIPSGVQCAAEIFMDFLNGFAKGQIGHNFKPFVPYLGTVLLFIVLSNTIAIFNVIPSGETLAAVFNIPGLAGFNLPMEPPTKNFNVTLCLALISMLVVVVSEFRYKKITGWLRGFYTPSPIFGFVKVLDYIVRPMSLCLRLFGNMLGGFIVMKLLYHFVPLLAPAVVGVYFDLFDGILQAFVFVFLTSLYIGEAVEIESE